MSIPVSVTEDALVEALGAFVQVIVGDLVAVVRGQQNRVPPPKGRYVYLTPFLAPPLSQPRTTYADVPDAGTMTLTRPTQWTVQVDCYGDSAQDMAVAVSIALRSSYGCDALKASGAQPLYTGDPRQLPFITGEDQYLERWSVDAVLQFNPSITVPQQFADELHVDLVEVDTTYPPGA
ncbi:phage neck terminator protein [Achromobacter sp. NCFB-sbj8-Ac1-l]|uniref:phage neck terminator protein n=1 Tax=unclassified Achromobacter TaxID=2626865 RepID=UPI004046B7AC